MDRMRRLIGLLIILLATIMPLHKAGAETPQTLLQYAVVKAEPAHLFCGTVAEANCATTSLFVNGAAKDLAVALFFAVHIKLTLQLIDRIQNGHKTQAKASQPVFYAWRDYRINNFL